MSDGFSLHSFAWTNGTVAGSALAVGQRRTISDSGGVGFQIIADPRNRGLYPLQVNGYGRRGRGNQLLTVVSPQWYHVSFSKLEIIQLEGFYAGNWITNISDDPSARIIPVAAPFAPSDLPSAMGGTYPAAMRAVSAFDDQNQNTFTESQALTRADPVGLYLGQEIRQASTFLAFLEAPLGQTITGGSVNIWRMDSAVSGWFLIAKNVAVPTGAQRVGIPVGEFLLRLVNTVGTSGGGDRWLVTTNGITVSGGATAVTVYQRIA